MATTRATFPLSLFGRTELLLSCDTGKRIDYVVLQYAVLPYRCGQLLFLWINFGAPLAAWTCWNLD